MTRFSRGALLALVLSFGPMAQDALADCNYLCEALRRCVRQCERIFPPGPLRDGCIAGCGIGYLMRVL